MPNNEYEKPIDITTLTSRIPPTFQTQNTIITRLNQIPFGGVLPLIKKEINLGLIKPKQSDYINSQTGASDFDKKSILGMNVYDTLRLYYTDSTGTITNPTYDFTFDIAMINVTQTRNIITTPVNNLNGTIKEYISDGDFSIDVKATLVFDGIDYYDYSQVNKLITLFKVQFPLSIESKVLNKAFNIQSCVITEYNIEQATQGMRNVQNVQFTMISDNPSLYSIIMIA